MADVCLVVPPFAAVDFPHLGTAVLKAACAARGVETRIVYANLLLAAAIGADQYARAARTRRRQLLQDRLFRDHAYPPDVLARLPAPAPIPADLDWPYDEVAAQVGPMVQASVAEILASGPRIVGLSSSFQQNLACSAIARGVKAQAPDVCVVMGGANVDWPLCLGLAKAFPWVDYFFAGESDVDFPAFCARLIRDGERPEGRIVRSESIRDMNEVCAPDFTDYFDALRGRQASGALPASLPRFLTAESSRGCWWGQKSHCTFCGLNGEDMGFRAKSPARMREELDTLAQWGVRRVSMSDNIMPHGYLTQLLPDLAADGGRMQLFYEVKANLTDVQIGVMAGAGITSIQPGIESLSSDVLRLMRKGVSAHQNIALLRACRAAGVRVLWNIIYGFPGEARTSYEAMHALLPRLAHLQPPNSCSRIWIDRYSPLHFDHEALGAGRLTPFDGYRELYPPEVATDEVAYHFDGDYSTELLDDPDLERRLRTAAADWRARWDQGPAPVVQLVERGSAAVVFDTRPIAQRSTTTLTEDQYAALRRLERPVPKARLEPELARHAAWLTERELVIDHEDKLMSIVVRPSFSIVRSAAQA